MKTIRWKINTEWQSFYLQCKQIHNFQYHMLDTLRFGTTTSYLVSSTYRQSKSSTVSWHTFLNLVSFPRCFVDIRRTRRETTTGNGALSSNNGQRTVSNLCEQCLQCYICDLLSGGFLGHVTHWKKEVIFERRMGKCSSFGKNRAIFGKFDEIFTKMTIFSLIPMFTIRRLMQIKQRASVTSFWKEAEMWNRLNDVIVSLLCWWIQLIIIVSELNRLKPIGTVFLLM